MRKVRRRIWWALIGLAVVLVVASCGGGEEETPTPSPQPTATPGPTATARPTASPTPPPTSTPVPTPFSLEPYVGLAHGVNLSVPKGWVIDDTDPDTLAISNPTGLATIQITMNTFLSSVTQAQFDEYVSLQILGLKSEFSDFQEVSREKVDAPPGFRIQFTFTSDGDQMEGVALYTFNDLRGARALASTEASFYDFFAPLFEEAIMSITVAPAPPGPTPTPAPTPIPSPTPFPTVTPGTFTTPLFSLQIPPGWGILGPGKEAVVRFIGPGRIIVQVLETTVPTEMSVQVYALALRENRYEPLAVYQLTSQGDIIVGPLIARELQFTAATGPDGAVNRYLVLVMRQGTQAYIVEAIGERPEFDQREAEVRAFVLSFRP
ncbi:MAG: hypothetical protein V3U26_03255 [Dehalococcoidia bacterium]